MAMSVQVKVNTSALRNAASEVLSMAELLQNDFNALQSCVKKTSRYWIGPAGDRYRQDFVAEKADMSAMLEVLHKYAVDILSMAGLYEQAEKDVARSGEALPTDIL